MSAFWKIPLQALILLVGVLVFVYYLFTAPPLLYNPAHEQAVRTAETATYTTLETRYFDAFEQREAAAARVPGLRGSGDAAGAEQAMADFLAREAEVQGIRGEALALAEEVTGRSSVDVNYIIPRFVLGEMPIGLAGLFIAAVIAAAMSSISSELNSLSTVTVIDFYRRWVRPEGTDAHFLRVSKLATALWGIFACLVATWAVTLGSLLEAVNRIGSFFYGSILGVFLLAMIPMASGVGAFVGLVAGMAVVATITFGAPEIAFLWLNVVGAVVVVVVGTSVSLVFPRKRGAGTGAADGPR
jgi:hypothetical protein